VSETPTFVAEGTVALTVPVAVAVNHVPPAGVPTAVVAVQVRAFAQAPLVVIARGCATGFTPPTTPRKLRACGVKTTEHAACTTKFTGIEIGLPDTGLPELSVPTMVIAPV